MNRKIDELGRLVIPKEMRDQLDLHNGDIAEIRLVDDEVIITNPKKTSFKEWLESYIDILRKQDLDIDEENTLTILEEVLEKYIELN